METRFSSHGVYRTEYHVVWIPKYRCRILNPGVRGYISKLFPKILKEIAKNKYDGKEVEVTLIVNDIVVTGNSFATVYSRSAGSGILFGFSSSTMNQLSNIQKGQRIVVIGKATTGVIADVKVDDCRLKPIY